ncbi:MAG: CTP synthase C-terminal region-related (seleno)protein [Opitutales bacterium]
MSRTLRILGDFDPEKETHLATNEAIEHTLKSLGIDLDYQWLGTEHITTRDIESAAGIWVSTGSQYRSVAKVLDAIRQARESRIPCLGTCSGFQHIMIEYAQNVLGIESAGHAEYDSNALPFISQMVCSLRGHSMQINLREGSLAHRLYDAPNTTEKYYCSFGINPEYRNAVDGGAIIASGVDQDGEIRLVEYPEHPFMLATLFVPQVASSEERPHPIVTGFLKTVLKRRDVGRN